MDAKERAVAVPAAAAPRYDAVDLLRGLSILAVVLLHSSLFLSFAGQSIGTTLPKWLKYMVFSEGGNGVSIFFAISGFLITFVSIRRFGALGSLSLKTFYRIRFARIGPLLLLFLAFLSIMHISGVDAFRIRPEVGSLSHAVFAALTFQINWYEAVHGWLPPSWTVLWSLSIEEMFYLAFPILCVVFMRNYWGRRVFFAILAFLVCFGPFARTPWYTSNDIWGYQSYLGNVDNIALGCVFGFLAERLLRLPGFIRSNWPFYIQVTGAILLLFIADWMWPSVILGVRVKHLLAASGTDVTVLGLGTCLVMLGSVTRNNHGSRWASPLRWLGRYSYEVYLTHEIVIICVLGLFLHLHRGPAFLWVIAVVVLSGLVGHLISIYVSEPLNRALRGAPLPAQLSS